jgi:3-oxoacyl-[acyl-carrier protein] reductase
MSRYLLISATSSIGQCCAKLLHSSGHQLFLTSRTAEKMAALQSTVNAPYAIIDPKSFEGTESVVQQAKKDLGGLDGIVCFAGSLLLKGASMTTEKEYLETIAASLTSAFATVRAASLHMENGGSVVLLSSAASLEGLAYHEAISAAKGGINSLVLSAAATYAQKKIRFNAVAPGLIKTELTRQIFENPSSLQVSEKMHPLGRLGTVEDVARAIAFFLDTQNDWITGQVLAVDGGLSKIKKGL